MLTTKQLRITGEHSIFLFIDFTFTPAQWIRGGKVGCTIPAATDLSRKIM